MEKNNKICIKNDGVILMPELGEVYLISSDGNYSVIHYGGEGNRGSVLFSLNYLCGVLPECFFRVSRKEVVNLDYMVSVVGNKSGGVITLYNKKEIKVSRRQYVVLGNRLRGESVIVEKRDKSLSILDRIKLWIQPPNVRGKNIKTKNKH